MIKIIIEIIMIIIAIIIIVLRWLAVTQTPVKNHLLELVGKLAWIIIVTKGLLKGLEDPGGWRTSGDHQN